MTCANVKFYFMFIIRLILLLLLAETAYADGIVTDNIRITSTALGYDLQYRVYLPQDYHPGTTYPVLYLTDGQHYLQSGRVPRILDRLINNGKINPVIAVFVDSRDPDNLKTNRRNAQFNCNVDYLRFFAYELIPTVEMNYPVIKNRNGRTIMGFSFGATNAACFGLMGYEIFSGIAMQSPANHAVPKLLPTYQARPRLPLKIFLSTGVPNDNTQANRKFHNVLKNKDYDMKYIEFRQGHNWENWRPLIGDILIYFYRAAIQGN